MRVMITNDDGIQAQGIKLLERCAREVFDDVWVVAPSGEQSGVSQSLSLHRPLRIERHGPRHFAIDGTPVDSVFYGLGHALKDKRPDLVLSGINHGPNVGYDIYYSGTVGAAREALIHGIPAVALSLSARAPLPFEAIAPAVTEVLRRVRDKGIPKGCLLNVNFPPPRDKIDGAFAGVRGLRGLKATRLGERFYSNEVVLREDPRGKPYFWIGGAWPRIEHIEGTDCEAVRTGWVSVSPLGLDVSDAGGIEQLNQQFVTSPATDDAMTR